MKFTSKYLRKSTSFDQLIRMTLSSPIDTEREKNCQCFILQFVSLREEDKFFTVQRKLDEMIFESKGMTYLAL